MRAPREAPRAREPPGARDASSDRGAAPRRFVEPQALRPTEVRPKSLERAVHTGATLSWPSTLSTGTPPARVNDPWTPLTRSRSIAWAIAAHARAFVPAPIPGSSARKRRESKNQAASRASIASLRVPREGHGGGHCEGCVDRSGHESTRGRHRTRRSDSAGEASRGKDQFARSHASPGEQIRGSQWISCHRNSCHTNHQSRVERIGPSFRFVKTQKPRVTTPRLALRSRVRKSPLMAFRTGMCPVVVRA